MGALCASLECEHVDVRAIILLGAEAEASAKETSLIPANSSQPDAERLLGFPVGALDLLGQPVVCHVIDRLKSYGISEISLLTSSRLPEGMKAKISAEVDLVECASEDVWGTAEATFLRLASQRPDSVMILRIGAYAEVDFHQLLKFHFARRNGATIVCDHLGYPLDIVALDPSRKIEAIHVISQNMRWNWRASEIFHSYGYVNLLRDGKDFRRLAEDALMRRCALIPRGQELKPGVWVGKHARIHRNATIEGPTFIGDQAKVGAGTFLSGCSTLEHHCRVDQRTLVDNSTVLPYSYVGESLNLVQSVVGFSQIAQVKRNATVSIADAKLTGVIAATTLKRTLNPMRAVLSKVSQTLADRFQGKDADQIPADPRSIEPQVDEFVMNVAPQKENAHAAAASASRQGKVKRRATHN